MTVAEYTWTVTGGRLPREMGEKLAALIRTLDGRRVCISVKEVKRKRSLQANAYLWGVVYPPIVAAFREHGNAVDADDVHLFCKQHVGKLKQVLVTPDGEVLHSVGSTARLGTSEFMDYVAAVKAWAKEVLDVNVPEPGELNNN